MTRDGMAAFLTRLGHRVVRTRSCYWYDLWPRFFLAIPHSVPVTPTAAELRALFGVTRGVGARFMSPVAGPGRSSYAFILDDRGYDLDRVSANTRSKIRRGLKHCVVRRLDPGFVRARGADTNADTLARMRFQQDVYGWDRYWNAVAASDGIEVWGAVQADDVLAYAVVAHVEGCAEILVARSRSDALRYYPNNALVFTLAQDLLGRRDVDRILFGLEPLEPVDGVNAFKDSMGFRREPLRQRVVFHPWLARVMASRLARRAAGLMAQRRPQVEFWRKLDGALSFDAPGPPSRPPGPLLTTQGR
jgi:hypothetical protein